jgi:pimeloyl-ACP methyl ester carboxylesterase
MESVHRSDVPANRSLGLFLSLFVIALVSTREAVAASDVVLNGHWEGSMTSQGAQLPVSFDFSQTDAGIEGRFTSPTQRAMDYPLDSVSIGGSSVRFILGGGTAFDGQVTAEVITGRFKGDDGSGSFALSKKEKPKLPYDVADVTFGNGDVRLSGTLVSPRTPGRHSAVVLLQGSGSETRWGTNRFAADRLARAGVAALIYDKRGSGASGGDWKTATYEDLARDALSGISLLRSRADVDPSRIGLHGHSQGGIVAVIAASLAPDRVAFIVAEDTVAGPVWEQDLYRVRTALAQEFKPADVEAAMRLYTLFVEVARGLRPYSALEAASAPVAKEPWFEWLAIPPRDSWLWPWYAKTGNLNTIDYWGTVKVPVLLVFGERDRLVPVDQSISQLEKALDKNGTPYTALIAPAAEHNLTVHPQAGEPFFWWHAAPGVVDTVVAWIKMSAESNSR